MRPAAPGHVDPEDLALDALVALRQRWDVLLRGSGRVTLQALGLEEQPQERHLSGVCAVHGRFHLVWRAPAASDRPLNIECPGDPETVCRHECAVDVAYEPARPQD